MGGNINIKFIKTKLMLSKVIFSLTVKFEGVDRNKLLGGRNMREARKKYFFSLQKLFLNSKFKTFGFLDTLKVYSPITLQVLLYLSFKQNQQKKQQTNFLCSSLFSFRFQKCDSSELQGRLRPLLQVQGALPPLAPPMNAIVL